MKFVEVNVLPHPHSTGSYATDRSKAVLWCYSYFLVCCFYLAKSTLLYSDRFDFCVFAMMHRLS